MIVEEDSLSQLEQMHNGKIRVSCSADSLEDTQKTTQVRVLLTGFGVIITH